MPTLKNAEQRMRIGGKGHIKPTSSETRVDYSIHNPRGLSRAGADREVSLRVNVPLETHLR